MKMKKFRYILLALIVLATTFGCIEDEMFEKEETTVEGSVLKLNEIMSKDVNDNPDWIEVYNSGSEDIDLSGYILNDKDVALGGFEIPAGTVITAGGFYLADTDVTGIKVGSGGEDVSLSMPDGTVIDLTTTPDMSSDVGLTWAREIDGDGEWMVSSPTPGTSNGSAANTAPILGASDLTEFDRVYGVSASDADGISSVKLVYMVNDGVVSYDMSLVDGDYKTSVPAAMVGDIVKYYVIATDLTGLSTVYPENGIETPGEYTVVGGVEEVIFSEVETAVGIYDFSFLAKVHYTEQVEELRLYYLLPGESQDDVTGAFDDKHKIEMTTPEANGLFKATISDLAKSTELRYYYRVEYIDGTRTYYPVEIDGGDFNHDLGTTWPTVSVGEIPVAPVNGFSELEITNEAAIDLTYNVNVEYDNGDPQEVKFYYYLNFDNTAFLADPTAYEDANRVSITWAGTLPTTDNMYNFSIPTADLSPGDEISWYMRAKDGNGDKMYYTFGKTAEEFDGDIKDDPTTWNVITKI
jgi:hypothetical protein